MERGKLLWRARKRTKVRSEKNVRKGREDSPTKQARKVHHAYEAEKNGSLKVPKREIFDRSDFPDFYTIKALRVGDFGVKIKKNLKNI